MIFFPGLAGYGSQASRTLGCVHFAFQETAEDVKSHEAAVPITAGSPESQNCRAEEIPYLFEIQLSAFVALESWNPVALLNRMS